MNNNCQFMGEKLSNYFRHCQIKEGLMMATVTKPACY